MNTGDLFERTFTTPQGNIVLLAEVEVLEQLLHLKDVVVYEESGRPLTGLAKEALAARTQLINEAIEFGFMGLRITGTRTTTSSSASPGHVVDLFVDLTRYISP